jgi:hypothetical protein
VLSNGLLGDRPVLSCAKKRKTNKMPKYVIERDIRGVILERGCNVQKALLLFKFWFYWTQ